MTRIIVRFSNNVTSVFCSSELKLWMCYYYKQRNAVTSKDTMLLKVNSTFRLQRPKESFISQKLK